MLLSISEYEIRMDYFHEDYNHVYVTLEKTGVYANSNARGDGAQIAVSKRLNGLEEIILKYPDIAVSVVAEMAAEVIGIVQRGANCAPIESSNELIQRWATTQVEYRHKVLTKAST